MFQQLNVANTERTDRLAAVCCWIATVVVATLLTAAWGQPVARSALALPAAGSTVMLAFAAGVIAGRLISGRWQIPLFVAAASVWFTPLLVAALQDCEWSLPLTGLFGAGLARGFFFCFATDDEEDPWRMRPSSFAGAAFLILAVVAVFKGLVLLVYLSVGAGCFFLVWAVGPKPKAGRALALRVALRLCIAIAAGTMVWTPHLGSDGTPAHLSN